MRKLIKKLYSCRWYLIVIIVVICVPILMNYTLFSWHVQGVKGNLEDWFGFLGSYLNVIVTGGFSFLLWRATLASVKVSEDSLRFQKEVNDLRSETLKLKKHNYMLELSKRMRYVINSITDEKNTNPRAIYNSMLFNPATDDEYNSLNEDDKKVIKQFISESRIFFENYWKIDKERKEAVKINESFPPDYQNRVDEIKGQLNDLLDFVRY